MTEKQVTKRFLQVDVQDMGAKLMFQCWMSTQEFWMEDEDERPFVKNHITVGCLWKIRSNRQLTLKQFELVCEYAEKLIGETTKTNALRQPVNMRKNRHV